MDLRCPKCNSADLKKVSLAYEEGLYRSEGRTRLSAAVVGGAGPDLLVGRANTRRSHQTALSKRLSPPVRWSYLRVGFWFVLAFFCVSWLIFYANRVATNSSSVTSFPLTLFALISIGSLVLALVVVWRHNHATYARRYAEWDRSFICQRCGALTESEIG
jgi:hypothetical protein